MVKAVNFLLYQTGWLACVIGAAVDRPWVGCLIALALVAVHLGLTTQPRRQLGLLTAALVVGVAVDSVLIAIGVFHFPSGWPIRSLPPPWMTVLWVQFATTFRYCFGWLSSRYFVATILSFVGAPLAFLGGERIGAVSILVPREAHLLALASVWAAAIPLLIYLSDWIFAGPGTLPGRYRIPKRDST